jgi:hypothetical protein
MRRPVPHGELFSFLFFGIKLQIRMYVNVVNVRSCTKMNTAGNDGGTCNCIVNVVCDCAGGGDCDGNGNDDGNSIYDVIG